MLFGKNKLIIKNHPSFNNLVSRFGRWAQAIFASIFRQFLLVPESNYNQPPALSFHHLARKLPALWLGIRFFHPSFENKAYHS